MNRRILFAILLSLNISALACSKKLTDTSKDSLLIKNTYDDWVVITNTKNIDKWSTFVAPDAVFLPPDNPPLESIDDIKKFYIALFQDPNFKLDCNQIFVEIAESGDLAWSRGFCDATFSTPDGYLGKGSSKWTKVWVRLSDGSWKCKLNTWNANQRGG